MTISRTDLADFSYFLAIAKHRNFRLAGIEVGVSASALSHALKGLEARMGVRLLNRTNRSVTLTAAGEDLRNLIEQPFAQIDRAADVLNSHRDAPVGRVRINVIADAAPLLLAPVLPVFADRYPDVSVEVVASDRLVDVIREGFDAGIRHGGTVPEDMIAQPLSADLKWVVAASPSYIERYGIPAQPDELINHQGLGIRLGDDRVYHWEFMGPDGEFAVSVPGKFIVDEGRTRLAMALAGVGLIYHTEAFLAPYVKTGDLRLVLEDWATTGPGYQIYYSSRHQVPTGLRLLISLIREMQPLGLPKGLTAGR